MDYDAIVIGAGFAGLYALKRLRDDLGLHTHLYEQGEGVGGTWCSYCYLKFLLW